ncbi:4'-phosphopantetheinyl transferase family protein [Bacillus horti]|uniref:4'-phosphopantetheinyl transferase family protein n=1 Tax=Caldalkalibacillus horti TaxID=77523 RepID=UPI0031D54E5D
MEVKRENKKELKTYTANLSLGLSNPTSTEQIIPFLSPREQQELEQFKFEKRRREYSLGRYVGKKSVQSLLNNTAMEDISIINGVFNQPVLYYPNSSERIQVSISHADHLAVALAFPEEHPMGIDVEKVSGDNEEALLRQMLDTELELLKGQQLLLNQGLTLLWTAKEALSKVLKTGLTVPLSVLAIHHLEKTDEGYMCEFKNFLQYKTYSWLFDCYVCSLCLPRNSLLCSSSEEIRKVLLALLNHQSTKTFN